jgi:hypothetical protein
MSSKEFLTITPKTIRTMAINHLPSIEFSTEYSLTKLPNMLRIFKNKRKAKGIQ